MVPGVICKSLIVVTCGGDSAAAAQSKHSCSSTTRFPITLSTQAPADKHKDLPYQADTVKGT